MASRALAQLPLLSALSPAGRLRLPQTCDPPSGRGRVEKVRMASCPCEGAPRGRAHARASGTPAPGFPGRTWDLPTARPLGARPTGPSSLAGPRSWGPVEPASPAGHVPTPNSHLGVKLDRCVLLMSPGLRDSPGPSPGSEGAASELLGTLRKVSERTRFFKSV